MAVSVTTDRNTGLLTSLLKDKTIFNAPTQSNMVNFHCRCYSRAPWLLYLPFSPGDSLSVTKGAEELDC